MRSRMLQSGPAIDRIQEVFVRLGIKDRLGQGRAVLILDTREDPEVLEARFLIPRELELDPGTVMIIETIIEELEEAGLIRFVDYRCETELGHGTSWGPVPRASRGMSDLHFLTFRLHPDNPNT